MLVIPALEWQRQADLWDSVDKQPSFLESIRSVKYPVSKNKVDGTTLDMTSGLHTVHIHVLRYKGEKVRERLFNMKEPVEKILENNSFICFQVA